MSGHNSNQRFLRSILLVTVSLALSGAMIGCDNSTVVDPLAGAFSTLRDTISTSRTLFADTTYVLSGQVVVRPPEGDSIPPVLTIQPGTVVLGEKATGGELVIASGAQLHAQGTRFSPIVFTSDQPVGSRSPGDWGGIQIFGNAPVNDQSLGYGGEKTDDSSGVLNYVRIEFAGGSSDSSALGLWGVGAGTILNDVQVHRSANCGVRFNGGTVSATRLLVTQSTGESVAWSYGWTGMGQYWAIQAQDGIGLHGLNHPGTFGAVPLSQPVLFNLTLVGQTSNTQALKLEAGTGGQLSNSIITGFGTVLSLGGAETESQIQASVLRIENNILFDYDQLAESVQLPSQTVDLESWLTGSMSVNRLEDPKLSDPHNVDAPVFYPASRSPAYHSDSLATVPTTVPGLEDALYAGAEYIWDPWISTWVAFPRN